MALPRITISGLCGGSGKTILSVGLIAAWTASGQSVVPFKKGPDYIDAGWLAQAAGRPCSNLDTFLVDPADTLALFLRRARPESFNIIEGNRGLFDSIDIEGTTSTAELAKLLVSPVVLVVDCTKTTRTMAALLMGCSHFDPQVDVRGVVLNRVANSRHEEKLRVNIERYCGIAVLGAFPKFTRDDFPERHMGLVPAPEHQWAVDAAARMGELVKKHVDIDRVADIARSPLIPEPRPGKGGLGELRLEALDAAESSRPVVGVVRDSAFQFYYPENLEALTAAGAEI
ncbi:MAG: cobyrinate a,c-diamide synthase, partial [Pseudomonadota bacterium]